MKKICVKENGSLKYFVISISEDEEREIICLNDITGIERSVFANSAIRFVQFTNPVSCIGQSAFENCGELDAVFFCYFEENELGDSCIRGIKLTEVSENFTIQKDAFKGCGVLDTVILPKIKSGTKVVIEKDAFAGCDSLRTVVLVTEEGSDISFTENPFADCSEHLTFVCKKDSAVERFARENGYRSVYA